MFKKLIEIYRDIIETRKKTKEILSAIEKLDRMVHQNNESITANCNRIINGIDKANQYTMNELCRLQIPLERTVNYKIRSIDAIKKLVMDYDFDTVLDVGCGEGLHTEFFLKAGKHVTSLDYGSSVYFEKKSDKQNVIIADFNHYELKEQFDCVWCSHILEHQPNVNLFLKKVFEVTKDNGVVAVTVPPAKHAVVGGHLTMWNAGILLYNLVLAGFDCSEAEVITEDYDISVIVRKKIVPKRALDELSYDSGDVIKISRYLPSQIDYSLRKSGDSFDGELF